LAATDSPKPLPSSVIVLPPTRELKALHTLVRNAETPRPDFIFYAERLSRLVIERGLAQLPFSTCAVTTPTNMIFEGLSLNTSICGVSVVRSGATMEAGLRKVVKDVPIGKILIQGDPSTGEPQVDVKFFVL